MVVVVLVVVVLLDVVLLVDVVEVDVVVDVEVDVDVDVDAGASVVGGVEEVESSVAGAWDTAVVEAVTVLEVVSAPASAVSSTEPVPQAAPTRESTTNRRRMTGNGIGSVAP